MFSQPSFFISAQLPTSKSANVAGDTPSVCAPTPPPPSGFPFHLPTTHIKKCERRRRHADQGVRAAAAAAAFGPTGIFSRISPLFSSPLSRIRMLLHTIIRIHVNAKHHCCIVEETSARAIGIVNHGVTWFPPAAVVRWHGLHSLGRTL